MKAPRSVAELVVLLHYYTGTAAPYPKDSITFRTCTSRLVDDGMVAAHENYPGQMTTTPKGDAFVAAIRNTPDPVCIWTVPGRRA